MLQTKNLPTCEIMALMLVSIVILGIKLSVKSRC